MQQTPLATPSSASHDGTIATATNPRDDVIGGLLWMLLGVIILVASWRMDRLEAQDINPYTIPGLVPGLLGLGMIFFSALMLMRGLRHGGLQALPLATEQSATAYGRLALTLALCIGFAVLLLGRVPFWLGSSLFVATSIVVLRFGELRAKHQLLRGLINAIVIGIGAGVAVSVVFEKIFLVRLP